VKKLLLVFVFLLGCAEYNMQNSAMVITKEYDKTSRGCKYMARVFPEDWELSFIVVDVNCSFKVGDIIKLQKQEGPK
jgi:hypothetical protein